MVRSDLERSLADSEARAKNDTRQKQQELLEKIGDVAPREEIFSINFPLMSYLFHTYFHLFVSLFHTYCLSFSLFFSLNFISMSCFYGHLS